VTHDHTIFFLTNTDVLKKEDRRGRHQSADQRRESEDEKEREGKMEER